MIYEILNSLIDPNMPLISNLSNASAALNTLDNINWCGFYIVKDNTLYLGPFQGDAACYKIDYGKGVCGTCLKEKKSIIVPNVNEFKGHIACSCQSKSEIVVPIFKNDEVVALIDIDAPIYNRFNKDIQIDLENCAKALSILF